MSKIIIIFNYPTFTFDQKLFMTLVLKSTFCTNHILMYIPKRLVTTRSFKTSASKLYLQLPGQTSKNGFGHLGVKNHNFQFMYIQHSVETTTSTVCVGIMKIWRFQSWVHMLSYAAAHVQVCNNKRSTSWGFSLTGRHEGFCHAHATLP